MTHLTKAEQATAQLKEELVQAILEDFDRSLPTAAPTVRLAAFFRSLDAPTLRAIAYGRGVFERELELDLEPREDHREAAPDH